MSHRNLGIKGMAREVAEVQEWVSTVMETPWEGTFEEYLKDGQVLCALINKISPGKIKKISTSKMALMQMENHSKFVKTIQAWGVPLSDCYDTALFAENKDASGVVRSLFALGGALQSNLELGWTGPVIGKKYAQKNVRTYTEEQLLAQKIASGAGSQVSQGSANVMERAEIQDGGITAGNAAAGAGSNEMSALAMGSAGVMERSAISKGGITAGNDAAGHGSSEISALAMGSAGVMERTNVTKSGITAGNDAAGHGSSEMSALAMGSAGVMERTAVSKGGITAGNDAAGAGSGEMSALAMGSAGVMERTAVSKGGN
eukprot:CAMPEP_0182600942 /NCGR_PEP_ID=MMETSP1324-20130603/91236_1 /TAXON_ID=236786 /ORGANISM="Florenciella sp., Strain RCC1587" /LENGTH=316 /DNA_ID=CAMNT_0024818851 /DNA_START=82 /DNA_END=1032 /DNA_ORIENTATION=+